MSKIDQRQLNILYCEGKKLGVVKDELETTSRHALEEYEGSSWREFGAMLKNRLSKIYEDYGSLLYSLVKMFLKEISLFSTMEIVLNQYRSLEEHLSYAG